MSADESVCKALIIIVVVSAGAIVALSACVVVFVRVSEVVWVSREMSVCM